MRAEYTDPLGEAVADGHVAYNVEFVTNNESFYTGRIGGVTKANMNSLETNYLLRSIKKVKQRPLILYYRLMAIP